MYIQMHCRHFLLSHTQTHTHHAGPVVPCQSGRASRAKPRAAWDPAKPSWWHKQLMGREQRGGRGRRRVKEGGAQRKDRSQESEMVWRVLVKETNHSEKQRFWHDEERERKGFRGGWYARKHAYLCMHVCERYVFCVGGKR